MNLLFIYTAVFDRLADGLLADEDLRQVELQLMHNPQAGAVVSGTGGVRKLRVALPGRGKSGSARVIYLYVAPNARVYFLLAYRKSAQATLSDAEKAQLMALARILREER
jgi:hypothetical protein